ncbi:hypothetical protein HK100_000267, partial [Physocladia obscura]
MGKKNKRRVPITAVLPHQSAASTTVNPSKSSLQSSTVAKTANSPNTITESDEATGVTTALEKRKKQSRLTTTARINRFHALTKKKAFIAKTVRDPAEAARMIESIQAEMDEIGGLHAYQRASLKGGDERSGRGACGKWLISHLPKLFNHNLRQDPNNLHSPAYIKLLDVGALNGETYAKQAKWISAEYIDLNPQHANVTKQNFFERAPPALDVEKFNIVCLSLVVNFVDDLEMR